ncbi:MAG: DHH family phosphoesterase, partial [Candidatus Thorarchaeota archaeon]
MNIIPLLESSSHLLILGHQNADPDAVCAMAAFKFLYNSINPKGTAILSCNDVSSLGEQVLSTLAPDVQITENITCDYDLIALLDTNRKHQLGPSLEDIPFTPSRTLVIDHHEHNPSIHEIAEHTIINPDKSSTCEIMFKIIHDLEIPLDEQTANLLLAGILFDTRRFFYADQNTLSIALKLIQAGANYQICVNSLITKPNRSERIARLKAASRLKIHDLDGWIIVTSKIGAFEASACRSMISLGADVAIVGGRPSNKTVRISSRSTKEFHFKTGVSLGKDVMEIIGKIIDGEGGGHSNAAGANGKKNLEKALKQSVDIIRDAIRKNSL